MRTPIALRRAWYLVRAILDGQASRNPWHWLRRRRS